jgi:serine/threonine-protein kinase RsbT
MQFNIGNEMDAKRAVMSSSKFVDGFVSDKVFAHRLATVVSELASNIIKYAGKGVLSIQAQPKFNGACFEVEARDEGPGITDKEQALEDGFSESGTLGLGLPGIKRLVDEFTLDSEPGQGTRVFVRKYYSPRS